jgi:hypothetical protein
LRRLPLPRTRLCALRSATGIELLVQVAGEGLPTAPECAYPQGVSVEHLSAAADVPRVRVAEPRSRLAMIAAAIVLPVAAVALALTLRGPSSAAPLHVRAQNGSYAAAVGVPLSVTAFRISNPGTSTVTIKQVRVAQAEPGLAVIGALAYRGCDACVTDSAVPPHVTPPAGVRAPPLLGVRSFQLKPGATLTLILSVKLAQDGRVHVPPLRIDLAGSGRVNTMQTVQGPELCAGESC